MASGDLTDAGWELVGPLLPRERGRPGRPGHENRPILDGILWRAREGARWRAVPERYGKWNTVWRRFARWRDLGVLEALFAALAGSGAAEERVQMLDRQHHDPRPPARGRRRRGQDGQALGRSRGGFTTIERRALDPSAPQRAPAGARGLHLRCDARGLPLALVLTPGEAHETRAFGDLVEDLAAGTRCVIGDMGYDADWLRQELLLRGVLPVIPPDPVRQEPVPLDRELYRLRNRVERLVSRLKQFRAVATRYDKTAESFLAFVHLAASRLWLRFVHTA